MKTGPPEHEDLLQELFGGIVVDGSSACVPGEVVGGGADGGDGNGGEGANGGDFDGGDSDAYVSPATSSYAPKRSLNRATASTATSHVKQSKNQMVKVMDKIHATLEKNCNLANKVMFYTENSCH